jgi:hypothetical protein
MSDEISIRRFTWLLDQRGYAYVDECRLEDAISIRGPGGFSGAHLGNQRTSA